MIGKFKRDSIKPDQIRFLSEATDFIRLAQGYDSAVVNGGTGLFSAGLFTSLSAITANAGGGRQTTGPSLITKNICIVPVGTVATVADSITLPNAITGSMIFFLMPPGLNSFQLWSLGTTDTIDNVNAGTQGGALGYSVQTGPNGTVIILSCAISTQWFGFGAFN